MARKRRGKPIHGWIVVDKPAGISSSAAVSCVRRYTGAAKAGHGGTLDPSATGVLPVALGEATKTVSYAMDGTKTYHFVLRWGEATTSDDSAGEVTELSDRRPTEREIIDVLDVFTGNIVQVPPIYSAIKVGGRRAYELARAGQDVTLAPRTVRIERIRLERLCDADHAAFFVVAGKGAYMRSLGRDIARLLGTVGHLSKLRRTSVGPFTENQAISLDNLETLGHSAPDSEVLLPVETVLADIPALALTDEEARKLKHGQAVPALPLASRSLLKNVNQGDTVVAIAGGKLVALATIKGGVIHPLRVMNF